MQTENPFEAPAQQGSHGRGYVSAERFPMDRCPHCQKEILFRDVVVQFSAFRFQCPRCQGRSKVEAPRLWTFFSAIVVIATVYAFGVIWLFDAVGYVSIGISIAGLLPVGIWAEWLWYKRLKRLGKLRPILHR